jgi:hypothetical protein
MMRDLPTKCRSARSVRHLISTAEYTLDLSGGVELDRAGLSRGGLRAFDVKIDDDGILTASHHNSFTGFICSGVDLLVRYVGRNIDEVSRSGFTAEFEMVSPSHTSPAANDVKDCLQFAMMVGTSLCVWLDHDRPCVRGVGGSAVFDLTGSRTVGSRCAQARRDGSFYEARGARATARPFARGCWKHWGKLGVLLG